MHKYIHTYIHIYAHTYTHTHINTYTHTIIDIYIHTYTHTNIHTYIRTYINTYIYKCVHTYDLTKRASTNRNIPEGYNKFPKSIIMKDLEEESLKEWQRKWKQTNKGRPSKEYFPDDPERLKIKLQLKQNFSTAVSGHGKTGDY